jgi:hypothetical protein
MCRGLDAAKMRECVWLRAVLVGQFEFAEWTNLQHSKFIALHQDKDAKDGVTKTLKYESKVSQL